MKTRMFPSLEKYTSKKVVNITCQKVTILLNL